MRRHVSFLLAIAMALSCGDDPTGVAPTDSPTPMLDLFGALDASSVTITLSPPVAYLERDDTVRFAAAVVEDGDTLDVDLAWFVSDTQKAQVDAEGLVTAREDGFAVLVAMWGGGLGAAALVIDTRPPVVVTSIGGDFLQQTLRSSFVAGRPVLVRAIVAADRENDWEPTAIVQHLSDAWPPFDTFPMTTPVGGIPVEVEWDDWKHLDSSFYTIIPGDSVKPGSFVTNWDWKY